jgi:phage tail tape-measure protein
MRLDVALVSFPAQHGAISAFAASPNDAAWKQEVAFVERHHNGRMSVRGTFAGHYVDVDESDHTSEPGTVEGAMIGALVGAIFGLGPPGAAFGLVFGGAVGAVVGKPTQVEAQPETLVDELRAAVPKGGSAVVLLAAPEHVDALLVSSLAPTER